MSAESSNLSNIEHRAVIKYFVKKGKTPKEIFEDMVSVLQESAPSYTMVKKWARLFQQGRESCKDDPRPGRPVTVVTEENVRKIEKLVLADQRIKLWQIAEELHISKERVGEIIHEHMNMRKISARWVPKMLTPFDKQRRLQTSKDFLELVGDNIDEICDRIVTVDETWVRQYDPESKQENGRKKEKGRRRNSRFKSRHRSLWRQFFGIVKAREAVVQKLSRGVLFLKDNASVHTARVSRQALKDTGFSEIDHPPYSPDLAPSYYFLFSNLKKELRGLTAGALAQLIASPTDLVKVQMQVEGRRRLQGEPVRIKNWRHAYKILYTESGVLGFWRGNAIVPRDFPLFTQTLVGAVPNVQRAALVNMGDLTAYDYTKRLLVDDFGLPDDPRVHTAAALAAGLVAAALGTPADVIKTRLMNQPIGPDGK
ncbi:Mitochondrial uncoupling protein 4 [Eumeta japonica]|uniref:Mitochondrial uncoupling protein 4 n=1 Tax=Eumeta variegata TaxID=151549 RepID=A0A4C1UTC4_EUMVA|nr:Mitochondrial uncoupling protein 4 [Eumeta japonica]